MHTHACRIVAFLCVLVRLVPIALGVPPERLESRGQAGGRLWFRNRVPEGMQVQFFRRREHRSADDTRFSGQPVGCVATRVVPRAAARASPPASVGPALAAPDENLTPSQISFGHPGTLE